MAKAKTKFIEQSAVIPYRVNGNGIEVLLVSSRYTHRWVLPKGMVASGMTEWESAEKEAFEEAGVVGRVDDTEVGEYKYVKPELSDDMPCRVHVYEMRVTNELDAWPEQDERKRKWMPIDEAAGAVHEKKLSKILKNFKPH